MRQSAIRIVCAVGAIIHLGAAAAITLTDWVPDPETIAFIVCFAMGWACLYGLEVTRK